MKCKACGRTINEKMKFCKYCGEPILGYEELIYDTVDRKTKNRILKIAILIVSMFVLILIFVAVFYFIFADKFLSEDKDMLNKDGIQNIQIKTTEDYDQTETENETQFATDDDTVQNNINLSHIRSITASSELSEEGTVHNATQIYDGSLNHAWVEGAAGNGIEESVEIVFVDSYTLNGIKINAGYQKSQDLYYKNSRPKKIRLYFSEIGRAHV